MRVDLVVRGLARLSEHALDARRIPGSNEKGEIGAAGKPDARPDGVPRTCDFGIFRANERPGPAPPLVHQGRIPRGADGHLRGLCGDGASSNACRGTPRVMISRWGRSSNHPRPPRRIGIRRSRGPRPIRDARPVPQGTDPETHMAPTRRAGPPVHGVSRRGTPDVRRPRHDRLGVADACPWSGHGPAGAAPVAAVPRTRTCGSRHSPT